MCSRALKAKPEVQEVVKLRTFTPDERKLVRGGVDGGNIIKPNLDVEHTTPGKLPVSYLFKTIRQKSHDCNFIYMN